MLIGNTSDFLNIILTITLTLYYNKKKKTDVIVKFYCVVNVKWFLLPCTHYRHLLETVAYTTTVFSRCIHLEQLNEDRFVLFPPWGSSGGGWRGQSATCEFQYTIDLYNGREGALFWPNCVTEKEKLKGKSWIRVLCHVHVENSRGILIRKQ